MAVTRVLGELALRCGQAACADDRGSLYSDPRDNECMRCLIARPTRGMQMLIDFVYQLGSTRHVGLWESKFGMVGSGVGVEE
jgi:hypothetical protein